MTVQTEPCKDPSAEDYFSDNTQGRKESRYSHESGAPLKIGKIRRRPPGVRRNSSFGDRILQAAMGASKADFEAQLDKLNIPRPDDDLHMPPVLRDDIFPYIVELL
jgi:hypothetical protein